MCSVTNNCYCHFFPLFIKCCWSLMYLQHYPTRVLFCDFCLKGQETTGTEWYRMKNILEKQLDFFLVPLHPVLKSVICTTCPLLHFHATQFLSIYSPEGTIVDTNTNHVPFTALPASQPWWRFMLPPGTCTYSAGVRRNCRLNNTSQQNLSDRSPLRKENARAPWRCEEWPINHSLSPSAVNEVTTLK